MRVTEDKKRTDFINLLKELSTSQDIFTKKGKAANIYKKIEGIYHSPKEDEKFRHYYSDIFLTLREIKEDKNANINILTENLEVLKNKYKPLNKDEKGNQIDVKKNIIKLYDHVNLDVSRMLYIDEIERRVKEQDQILELHTIVKKMETDINITKESIANSNKEMEQTNEYIANTKKILPKIEKKLDIANNKITNQQKEYIAILGVFAAVVLAFNAGITFSASVLDSIGDVSVYRIAFVTLIIGFVLINTMYALFYYIDRIVYHKSEKSLKPLMVSNVIIIIFLIIIMLAWSNGWIESRNEEVHNKDKEVKIYHVE